MWRTHSGENAKPETKKTVGYVGEKLDLIYHVHIYKFGRYEVVQHLR